MKQLVLIVSLLLLLVAPLAAQEATAGYGLRG